MLLEEGERPAIAPHPGSFGAKPLHGRSFSPGQTASLEPADLQANESHDPRAKLRGVESNGMILAEDEVAIGPDAEVFTKAPVLSTVGWGAEIGVRSDSTWNNPEPELVLVASWLGEGPNGTPRHEVRHRWPLGWEGTDG